MRAASFVGLTILVLTLVAILPSETPGQPGGKSKGKGMGDPGSRFDQWSNGRTQIPISEAKVMNRTGLEQFLKDKGVTNGMLTRQLYIDYFEQATAKMYMQQPGGTPGGTPGGVRGTQPGGNEGKGFQTPFPGGDPNGGFGGKKKFGDGGGFPGGMVPGINPSVALNPDAVNQQADMDFRRRDNNGDGRLAIEEVPQDMRRTFLKWDKNADGFIMVDEYREFFMARAMGSLDEMSGSKGVASIIVDEEELDRKTVVIRAGKLPTGLPEWFSELDYDKDGQVALWEWRKGGKSVEDFGGIWDLNDDGFITPEEALRSQSTIARNSKNGDGTSQSANGDNRSKGKGKWGGFGGDPNGGGNGERPAWGPGGMFPGGGGGGMFPGGGGGKDGGGKKGKKGGG